MLVPTLTTLLLLAAAAAADNSVTVTMDAKWPNTPFVAEISEFLAAEDSSLFWRYLDNLGPLVAEDKLAPTEDEESVYAAVLAAAQPLLSPGLFALLQLALASRAYSPAVEMNRQLAFALHAQFSSFPCPEDAGVWAVLGSRVVCSSDDLKPLLTSSKPSAPAANDSDILQLLRTDKVFGGPAVTDGAPVVMLYGDLRHKDMHAAHRLLSVASKEGRVQYVFRHRVRNANAMKTRLSGYGVELAIKSTEYKAMDDTQITNDVGEEGKTKVTDRVSGFDFAVLRSLHPNYTKELNDFRQHLLDSETEIVPLKAWQLQDLSFQAAQKIASVADTEGAALAMLEDLSQNYPIRAHALSQISVSNSFRGEIQRLQSTITHHLGLDPGASALFVNGYLLNDVDPISILELLRRESRVMEGLHNLGVSGTDINKILRSQRASGESSSSSSSSKFALDIRQMPVVYFNDLEDGSSRYYGWPSSVRSLLEQTFPGMLRRVAKNLFNLVLLLDPENRDSWPVMRYAQAFVVHAAPVRVGVVWVVEDGSVGEKMARAFNYVAKAEDEALSGLEFLVQVITEAEKETEKGGAVTRDLIHSLLEKRYSKATANRVVDTPEFSDRVKEGREYLTSSGLSSRLPHVLLNGVPLDRRQVKDMFEETVVGAILEQTPVLQTDVYEGRLSDHQPTVDYLMTRSDVVPRLNQLILDPDNTNFLAMARRSDLPARVAESLVYLSKREDSSATRAVSMWLAVDLARPAARLAVYDALKVLRSSPRLRMAVVHVGSKPQSGPDLALLVHAALRLLPAQTARLFVTKLVKEENWAAVLKGERRVRDLAVGDMDFDDFEKKMDAMPADFRELHAEFGRHLRLTSSAPSAVVANGKVYGPLPDAQLFGGEDLRLLERVAAEMGGAEALATRLQELRGDGDLSDLTMRASALLQAAGAAPETSLASANSKRRFSPLELPGVPAASEAVVRLPATASEPAFQLVAVVDPLSRDAQKIASVLRVLRGAVNCEVHLLFNCKPKLSEQPLNTFYRLVWAPRPDSAAWGRALFADMPGAPLLTLGVDAPHAWMVAPVRSLVDLDNIRMAVTPRVTAHFELEHLLLEGHCVDTVTGQPPRGLQFTLASRRGSAEVDTIVMANLGYFQMKANPGAWFLQLRGGRSKDIYDISGHQYTDNMPDSPEVIAVIDSLRSKIIRVRVAKKADKMDANLLGDDEDSKGGVGSGLWNSISSAFGGPKKKAGAAEVLNIFSVASGHLYERFLRIMMLSVLKRTKQPVKFWFLKNFLSPTFKDFIPHMAKEYKFEYELVEYKWPRWLQHQTEKQRVIWGYKILFLDVLFPLDVHKIIFVDADQIVRTDLQELADLDLEGAPYGYTPFCDSRREMDGFRFWKSGYWAQHLGNRRYHISALYVVDLLRFRRLAAGDRLRGQYQGLSQDPNSLSNLDQDLPNNMIHQVPIKSLPQEWLWCETWCSSSELARAKTIDLCNNPQTKEPKLQAARRIVPEWSDYDEEVKRLWDRVYGTKTAGQKTAGQKTRKVGTGGKEEL